MFAGSPLKSGVRYSVVTPLRIGYPDPRDVEEPVVRRDVFNLVRDIHVKMNAALRAIGRVAAADVQARDAR